MARHGRPLAFHAQNSLSVSLTSQAFHSMVIALKLQGILCRFRHLPGYAAQMRSPDQRGFSGTALDVAQANPTVALSSRLSFLVTTWLLLLACRSVSIACRSASIAAGAELPSDDLCSTEDYADTSWVTCPISTGFVEQRGITRKAA